MTDLPVHLFSGLDGVELAWREVGSGRPFVLLHGLMGSGALLAGQGLVPALAEAATGSSCLTCAGTGTADDRTIPPATRPTFSPMTCSRSSGAWGSTTTTWAAIPWAASSCCACWPVAPARLMRSWAGRASMRSMPRATGPAGTAGYWPPSPTEPRCQPGRRRRPPRSGSGRAGLTRGPSGSSWAPSWRRPPTLCDRFPRARWSLSATGTLAARRRARSLAGLLPHGQLVLVPGDHFTAFGAPEFTAAVLEFLGKSLPANASR